MTNKEVKLLILKDRLESDLRVVKKSLKETREELEGISTDWLRGYYKGLIVEMEIREQEIESNLSVFEEV